MPVPRKSVGTTGRRRIVPMLGIDFIAGDLAPKGEGIKYNGQYKYGRRLASMGGRTRAWSNINFLQVNPSGRVLPPPTQNQIRAQSNFRIATGSQRATIMNLAVRTQVQYDYLNGVIRQDVNPKDYATLRGWVTGVRFAQIAAGVTITETTDTWNWT